MKLSLYTRLAFDGIRKNRALYYPYLFTGVLMTAVYYILGYLASSEIVGDMAAGETMRFILGLGTWVLAVFSAIFLFYTNSFLIRRRKKEFGLFNVLGMTKKNISKILFRETVISYIISLAVGLAVGIGVSKLAELALLRLVEEEVGYEFRLPAKVAANTAILYAVIFLAIFLNGIRLIRRSNTIELVKSEAMGEKPPKANYVLGLAGALLLAGAYYLAVAIEDPISALIYFFIAVLMVIVGTYLFFISGSVAVCRLLQKNKRYYYKAKNFVSVSGMTFRMKRNGAGLASICILLTMVLVMLSSSACLYFGRDKALTARFPRDVCVFSSWYGYSGENENTVSDLRSETEKVLESELVRPEELISYAEYCISGLVKDSSVEISLNSKSDMSFIKFSDVCEVHFLSADDYNRAYGKNVSLSGNEVVVCPVKIDVPDEFSVGSESFRVKERISPDTVELNGASLTAVTSNLIVIVDDVNAVAKPLSVYTDYNGDPMLLVRWYYEFNFSNDSAKQLRVKNAVEENIRSKPEIGAKTLDFTFYASCHDAEKSDFVSTFGGLFFIGILLSAVFLTAAVLIIYYKQISEGYEDRARFRIMRKVGMTKKDIRRSINAQMLFVFMLPIIFAMSHIGFAFPFIRKMVMLFGVFHTPLLIATTACAALLCAAFYAAVYRLTSNAYYSIVTDAKE